MRAILLAVLIISTSGCTWNKEVEKRTETRIEVPAPPAPPAPQPPVVIITVPPTQVTTTTPSPNPVPTTPTAPTTPTSNPVPDPTPGTPTSPTTPTTTVVDPPVPDPTPTTSTTPTTPVVNPQPVPPLRVFSPSDVTGTSATLRGNVNWSWNGVGEVFFQWKQQGIEGWASIHVPGRPNGDVSLRLEGNLLQSANYSYRLIIVLGPRPQDVIKSNIVDFTTGTPANSPMVSSSGQMIVPSSSRAKATEALPLRSSVILETRGYTNLTDNGVTVKGYVDVPATSDNGPVIFFQMSLDKESWPNWFHVGRANEDKEVKVHLYNLNPNTTYFYRLAVAYNPEEITYDPNERQFTTLNPSDERNERLEYLRNVTGEVLKATENLTGVIGGSRQNFHPKTVAAFSSQLNYLYGQSETLREISQPRGDDSDGGITEELAKDIRGAMKGVSRLRTTVDPYFDDIYDAEEESPYSTFDPPIIVPMVTVPTPTETTIVAKSGRLNVVNLKSEAMALTSHSTVGDGNGGGGGGVITLPTPPTLPTPSPIDNGRPVYIPNDQLIDIINVLIEGTETLTSRSYDAMYRDYNDNSPWTRSYVSMLANKAFVAARITHDLMALPEIDVILPNDLKVRARNMDRFVFSLRMSLRDYEDRTNSSSRINGRQAANAIKRQYIDGENMNEAMGKSAVQIVK